VACLHLLTTILVAVRSHHTVSSSDMRLFDTDLWGSRVEGGARSTETRLRWIEGQCPGKKPMAKAFTIRDQVRCRLKRLSDLRNWVDIRLFSL